MSLSQRSTRSRMRFSISSRIAGHGVQGAVGHFCEIVEEPIVSLHHRSPAGWSKKAALQSRFRGARDAQNKPILVVSMAACKAPCHRVWLIGINEKPPRKIERCAMSRSSVGEDRNRAWQVLPRSALESLAPDFAAPSRTRPVDHGDRASIRPRIPSCRHDRPRCALSAESRACERRRPRSRIEALSAGAESLRRAADTISWRRTPGTWRQPKQRDLKPARCWIAWPSTPSAWRRWPKGSGGDRSSRRTRLAKRSPAGSRPNGLDIARVSAYRSASSGSSMKVAPERHGRCRSTLPEGRQCGDFALRFRKF